MRSRLRVKKLQPRTAKGPDASTDRPAARKAAHRAPAPAERRGRTSAPHPAPLVESAEEPVDEGRGLRFIDLRNNGTEASRDEVASSLAREGREDVDALMDQLVPGDRIGRFLVTPPPAPPLKEVIEITEANYFRAYRWTTGRSRFPLDEFLKVVIAKRADIYTAIAWAEEWTGVRLTEDLDG